MYKFNNSKIKVEAREECLIRFFREQTGSISIPPSKQFWSLCNKQSKRKNSEINQLISSGLITIGQYYGVDRDVRNIRNNKKNHPEANWFYGEWDSIIRKQQKIFNPAIVFLDSTSMAGTDSLIQSTYDTMLQCPSGTFIFVNVMLNNPRDPKKIFTKLCFIDKLVEVIQRNLFDHWYYPGKCFTYNATGHTKMATYPLIRKT